MRLLVNGQPIEISAESGSTAVTVESLLRDFRTQAQGTRGACAVEVNRRVVPRREHPTTVLADGDTIEIVTLVGGG